MSEEKINNSKMKKFWTILVTLLLLLIPIAFMFGIIGDREKYKREAVDFVSSSWGHEQTLNAPRMYFTKSNGKSNQDYDLNLNNYNADVKISTEVRKKGIFHVPVYTADVTLSGDFTNNYGNIKDIKTSFAVTDTAGFIEEPSFKIGSGKPQTAHKTEYQYAVNTADKNIPFEIKYKIRGINELHVSPKGQNNKVKISGNWKDPSFIGNFLPTKREVNNEGFTADWSVPGIAVSDQNTGVGVSLLLPVDNYRMAERCLKYAFLFLSLTFLSYFIFEIISKENKKIHQLQYCLLGGAMLIFYLLLVSMSELLPFGAAYIISAIMVISMITAYTYFVITKRGNPVFSTVMALFMILLYAFLYILLSLQDLALLIGSLGLFIIIGSIMYITRDVDWYSEK